MIKKAISLFALCIPLILQSQITVSVQLPPAGLVQKDQLWNLVLSNNGTSTEEITIFLNLRDALTGESVLSAGTRSVSIAKSVKLIGINDVRPVQYHYGLSGFNNTYLPLGSYIACYTIARGFGEQGQKLGEECVRINVSPLSPPLLNSPLNKAVVNMVYPQFSWVPPAPLDMFDNLNYDVAVAEVFEGQSPAEAILYNTPVYSRAYLKTPYENYPSTFSRLQAGKTYAWQVTAKNNLNYSASTDVWTFTIAADSAKTSLTSATYVLLKQNNEQAGINYIPGNNLFVKYYCYDKEHETTVRLLNAGRKVVQEIKQKVIYGDNFLHFTLNDRFQSKQIYFIEITDLQNNKLTASFTIQ